MEKLNFKVLIFDIVSNCDNDCLICLVNKKIEEIENNKFNKLMKFIEEKNFENVNDLIFGQGDVFKITEDKFKILIKKLNENKTIKEVALNTTYNKDINEVLNRLNYINKNNTKFLEDVDDENNEKITRKFKYKINYVLNPLMPLKDNLKNIEVFLKNENIEKISFQLLINEKILKILNFEKYENFIKELIDFLKPYKDKNDKFFGILLNVQYMSFTNLNLLEKCYKEFIQNIHNNFKEDLYNINDFGNLNVMNIKGLKINNLIEIPYRILINYDGDLVVSLETLNENFLYNTNVNVENYNNADYLKNIKKNITKNKVNITKIEKCKKCKNKYFCEVFPFFNLNKYNQNCKIMVDSYLNSKIFKEN